MKSNENHERYVVVGDVHGCREELLELLKTVDYQKGPRDCLVFAGDLVDRGPDPVGCVRLARELEAPCVVGNHEEKHIRWRSWEDRMRKGDAKKNPMRRFDDVRLAEHNKLNEDDMNYLRAMPKVLSLGNLNWLVVHAGFECNDVRPEEQARDTVCRVRDLDPATGKMATNSKNPLESVVGSVPWATLWPGPQNVVYGHAVHGLDGPRVDQHDGYACYGVDTGCVFGGKLTAIVVTASKPPEFVQVKAKQAYHSWESRHSNE